MRIRCASYSHSLRSHYLQFNESESECDRVNPFRELVCNAHCNSDRIEHVTHLIKDGRNVELAIVRALDEVTSASFALLFGVCAATYSRRLLKVTFRLR